MKLVCATGSTQAEELQPVFVDFVACSFGNGFRESIEVVTIEELHVDDVRVAADRAIFAVGLLIAGGAVERDDHAFAAGGARVRAFVLWSLSSNLFAFAFHFDK